MPHSRSVTPDHVAQLTLDATATVDGSLTAAACPAQVRAGFVEAIGDAVEIAGDRKEEIARRRKRRRTVGAIGIGEALAETGCSRSGEGASGASELRDGP